jgi:hypothetical protein
VLRELGVEQWDGEPLDEDLLALRAQTLLPAAEDSLPAGASSRRDYRYELPVVAAAAAGTSAAALAGALEVAGGGDLRCVPLSGRWTGEAVARLVETASTAGAYLLANLRTGRLWGSKPPLEALLAELRGQPIEGPPPDWDVGHFCELVLAVRGPVGSLVLVRDTYPTLGWHGHHLQPPRALAAALDRGDGREGGVLAVAPPSIAGEVEAAAVELGLEVAIWDNGTRR